MRSRFDSVFTTVGTVEQRKKVHVLYNPYATNAHLFIDRFDLQTRIDGQEKVIGYFSHLIIFVLSKTTASYYN